jgi:glycosyltransferase involved in cell wall biosynthesis
MGSQQENSQSKNVSPRPGISIVLPLFNECGSLATLYDELCATSASLREPCEFVFVDDGSTDASWAIVTELVARDERVIGIRFRRNVGKAAALAEGFAAARGGLVITMDADLQDDPREIPRLIGRLQEGFDVVSGWKRLRNDPWHKVGPSRVFNWMVGSVTGLKLHDHNCGLKCYRADVVREIRLYGEMHRFITVLAHARGFRVTEIEVNHRPRLHGCSKYGIRRFINGILDLMTVRFVTVYGQRPAHLLGAIGLFLFAAGMVGLAYLGVLWVLGYRPIGNRPLLFYSVAGMLLGFQSLSFGILAELLTWKLFEKGDVTSPVSERIGSSILERTGGGPAKDADT